MSAMSSLVTSLGTHLQATAPTLKVNSDLWIHPRVDWWDGLKRKQLKSCTSRCAGMLIAVRIVLGGHWCAIRWYLFKVMDSAPLLFHNLPCQWSRKNCVKIGQKC